MPRATAVRHCNLSILLFAASAGLFSCLTASAFHTGCLSSAGIPTRSSLFLPKHITTIHSSEQSSSSSHPTEPDESSKTMVALSWIGSSTSLVVSGTFFFFLAWKRDALMVSFFIGAILNGILSKLLKRIIDQSRPTSAEDVSDKGMPSSHAMSLAFIATFTALHVTASSWTITPLLILYTSLSLYYRVQVRLHTTAQVVVGLLVGCTNGWLWSQEACLAPVMQAVQHVLGDDGVLPIPLLLVPALVGAATVGSIERRLPKLWETIQKKKVV